MGAVLIGFILGALAGAATGSVAGVAAGGALGALLGLMVFTLSWVRAHMGDAPTVERHRVMCMVFGQPAECDFAGDLDLGHWHGVQRCSLLPVPARVDCEKGCLPLLGSAGVRPGRRLD